MKTKKLDKQLATYSTAAGALLLGATGVNAAVQYTAADLTVDTNNSSVSVDIDGNSTIDIQFMWSFRDQLADRIFAAIGSDFGSIATQGSSVVRNFSASEAIGAGASWTNYGGQLFMNVALTSAAEPSLGFQEGLFSDINPGFVGVYFAGDSGNYYGWVNIDSIVADGSSYHISGYAYNDIADAPAAVPEPSSLALLALGVVGVRSLRRFNRPGA